MSLTPFDQSGGRDARVASTPPIEPPLHEAPTRTTPTPGGKKPVKWVPIAIIAVLLIGGLVYRQRQSAGPGSAGGPAAGARGGPGGGGGGPRETVVQTVAVTTGNLTQTLPLTGSLRSNQVIDLNSKIQGRVARVLVDEGDRVRRGQLLIALDDADLRAQVAAARAGLRTAQARLQQSVVGLPARVQQVGTSIEQAEAALQTARARYRQALLSEPVARSTAEGQVRTARETVRTAQARLAQARGTTRQVDIQTQGDIRQAEAGVRTAEAAVRGAEAGVAGAQATLAEVQRGAREQQVATAQAQVTQAEATLRDAEAELNRQRFLFQNGAAARANVDTAQTRFDVTRAQLEAARQNLSLVREGATTEQVRQAQESVRQAEEGVRQAQEGVRTAQSQLSNARAARIRVTTEQGNVTAALAALGQAQSGLQTALSNLAQIPITQAETRTAFEAVQQAESTLSQARANRSQIPIARSDIGIAQAAVQNARATLDQAQVQLAYARIYSPVNGVVNQKLADVGETTGTGTALLNLVSLDRVYFEAQVPESSVRLVRVGQPAQITVPAVSDRPVTGYVTEIIPVSDQRLRQFRVRISIPNAPRELTPGAFARGTLTARQVFNALILPANAITEVRGQPTVIVAVQNGKKATVKYRVVQTGLQSGNRTQVIGGVRKGDLVIVDNSGLDDGE
ncbi:MAG: HlyD family secretion protein, partial [Abditibacteriota bacterium]|nr:HlyD family secretion protein [Abditibacteriota bacterium]